MILIKGNEVRFEMSDGSMVNLPPEYGMVHDPNGEQLPYCDMYFGPYESTGQPADLTKHAKAYFGRSYKGVRALVDVPRENPWQSAGEIKQIFYKRPGRHAARYYHVYNKDNPKPERVMLYKTESPAGTWYLADHGGRCTIDDRGIVRP